MEMNDYTLEGLVRILRGKNPAKRSVAAVELGKRGDTEAVESLIRSFNEDPDDTVRAAARAALSDLLGAEVDLAIRAYGTETNPDDPWIQEDDSQDNEVLPSYVSWKKSQDEPDWAGTSINELVHYLRGEDPELRARAAVELGERHDTKAVEFLIRSFQEDPDEDVQDAAFKALEDLLGSQARMAIDAFKSNPETDGEWLIAEDESQDAFWADDAAPSSVWNEEDLNGFISILHAGGDPAVRVRAIQELKTIRDMRAVDAIAMTAAWSNDEPVQAEALKAMEELFGDETESVLASYQKHGMLVANQEVIEETENETEPKEDEEQEEAEAGQMQDWISTSAGSAGIEPVVKEEKAGIGTAILIAAILLALILYLLLR